MYLSKHSLLQRNVSKVNQPVPSGEEIKGMKMDILESFQSRLNLVGWRCFFSLGAFFRSSRCSGLSTVKIQNLFKTLRRWLCFHLTTSSRSLLLFWHQKWQNTMTNLVYILNETWHSSFKWWLLIFFDRKTRYFWQNLIVYDNSFVK